MSSNTLSIATSGSGNSPKSPMPRSLESISSRYWDRQAQRRSLPAVLAEKLENREELTKAEKNEVAAALHAWALERGAANFAHWFSPKRGSNASKYDAFIDLNYGTGDIQVEFSGSKLFQSETDGSSFPNGGLRVTHSAAAYVGWDMTSYPFVREGTLFIPSVLVTYNGEPLDDKTPLLRAQEAVSRSATRLLNLMGDNETTRVISNVGWEQEFFVVSRKVYLKRPDLIAAGRALFGKVPAKNQAREENYFSMPNLMVKKLFSTSAGELRKLGVSMNVAHAEVAPGQFEVSPIFTLTSRAADQNVLAREVMDETAHRLGLVVLWHEKPFAGINGSGKHANWGLNTNTGTNLFVPGKTQQSQERFTAFVAALSAAVFRHGDLLRIGTATAGNDHRLGAQEAPPAIISLYTGKTMGAHLEKVANEGGELHGYDRSSGGDSAIDLGTSDVQTLHRSLEDRNRTTPFPFCGNRFEFRAVGSAQNIAWPLTLLNTAMADALDSISDLIEGGKSVRDAVAETLRETLPAVFNGNNYADEWVVEAEKRGLWHLHNTAEALPQLTSEKNIALFAKHGIATEAVVHAWQHIHAEQYVETLHLEARSMLEILHTGIIPAVMQDAGRLASSVTNVQSQALQSYVGKRTALAEDIVAKTEALDAALSASEADEGDLLAQAKNIVANLIPAMNAARVAADQAENVVDRSAWPLPTISEVVYSNHVETD